jgi:hypothetical protein
MREGSDEMLATGATLAAGIALGLFLGGAEVLPEAEGDGRGGREPSAN